GRVAGVLPAHVCPARMPESSPSLSRLRGASRPRMRRNTVLGGRRLAASGNDDAKARVETDAERWNMSDVLISRPELESLGVYEFGWADSDVAGASARRGIDEEVVADISRLKNEPEWMLKNRLKGLRMFLRKPMPAWGADLSGIDF